MLEERLPVTPRRPGPGVLAPASPSRRSTSTATGRPGRHLGLVARGDGDTPVMRLLGHYDDTYVREHGRWRFQRRIAHTDIPYRDWTCPPTGWRPRQRPAAASPPARARQPMATTRRLRRLEDLEQIHQLFIDYKTVLDRKDFGAYAALFAEDGEFIAGAQRAKGRAAIQALVAAMPGTTCSARRSARTSTWWSTRRSSWTPTMPTGRAPSPRGCTWSRETTAGLPVQARALRRRARAGGRPVAVPAPRGAHGHSRDVTTRRRSRTAAAAPRRPARRRRARTASGPSTS